MDSTFLADQLHLWKSILSGTLLKLQQRSFSIHRHNEIRDLAAELLTQVYYNFCLESNFQLRTANTADIARLDISVDGFWQRSENAFFDVRIFNLFASTNLKHQLGSCYHKMKKRRQYDERVREIERGSFAPLVFATSGGMGKQTTVFYKRLASLLILKKDQPYSHVIGWIRCHLGFTLFRQGPLQDSSPVPPIPMPWTSQSVRVRWQCHKLQYKLFDIRH